MKNFINKPNIFKRWILFLYSILTLIITIIYIIFNHTFFKVDWQRYDIDGTYRGKVDEILKHGVFWINGNLTEINSSLLVLLLAIGAILSLLIFYLAWHNLATRTWTPYSMLCRIFDSPYRPWGWKYPQILDYRIYFHPYWSKCLHSGFTIFLTKVNRHIH
ncbi:hypothetical protein RU92_GL000750 [Lactococcus cremoris subsp. tructae]|uniref:Uncharacterized protein n=1 Tax=Lactococcus cremoris subsp. tructae TaxID=542833 RepID=A0A2A5SR55_LACLC|nr:Transporter [Lactococcus cremoris]MDU8930945.1 hypothetical protein [Lactococcus cremoris]PCS17180.1 hypothetical protein RU92_GL000750 [Lactococcus cremoris subsp. tructae]